MHGDAWLRVWDEQDVGQATRALRAADLAAALLAHVGNVGHQLRQRCHEGIVFVPGWLGSGVVLHPTSRH